MKPSVAIVVAVVGLAAAVLLFFRFFGDQWITVSGRITDAATAAPVVGARVELRCAPLGPAVAISGAGGAFTTVETGDGAACTLHVEQAGYRAVDLDLAGHCTKSRPWLSGGGCATATADVALAPR